ncbi:MAG: hypothetical protein EA382_15440 [Spirochaetaceae bacterium]|nr:MAG: hypothetical protein EA382_15440 [Spirochaetaceae bacterium]
MDRPESTDRDAPRFYSRAPDADRSPVSESPARRRRLFTRNRSLVITVLDLSIVLLIFGIYFFVLAPDPSRTRVDGVLASVESFAFDDQVYVTVTVTRTERDEPVDGARSILVVVFDDGTRVVDALPHPDEPIYVRHVIAGVDAADTIRDGQTVVIVTIAGEERELVARIGR